MFTVTLSLTAPKKHSVRFDSPEPDAPIKTLYVAKADWQAGGAPQRIAVRVDAAKEDK